MKKGMALVMAAMMVLVMAACQHGSDGGSSDPAGTTVQSGGNEEVEFTPITSAQAYFEADRYVDTDTGEDVRYLFHEPVRDTGKAYPLVIFLHGLGDTVDEWQLGTAGPLVDSLIALENESDDYSAYTLIPSTPLANEGWWTNDQLMAFIKLLYQLKKTHSIDAKRIYITGLSMGGFTTCQLVNMLPLNTFAAVVPLSGASNMNNPELLKDTAFRIYHSTYDNVVNVSCARELNRQLVAAGHPKVEYIEFPDGDHVSPIYTVYTHQRYMFFSWLFAQKLP